MKKTLLAAAALAALAFAGSASAATQLAGGTLSYNIGVTNDYVFRGLSQTDGDAALRALVAARPDACDFDVRGAGLEAAFLQLTADEPTEGKP